MWWEEGGRFHQFGHACVYSLYFVYALSFFLRFPRIVLFTVEFTLDAVFVVVVAVVVAVPSCTALGSPSTHIWTLANKFHRVRGSHVSLFFFLSIFL